MTDDRPAPRPRMTRADFILLTVGAELRRAGDYLHHQQVLRAFEARLPELEGEGLIDQVVLRWWRPDGTFLGAVAMKLTPPGTFAGPGFEGGDYVAEGRLPVEPGHTLQVAVHRYTDPEVAMAVDGEVPDPWTWANREALDRAAGVELITGRYLPTADTVLRLVATERSRPELVKARQIELEHGRDDVVAAIDRRLAELPPAPAPPPRHLGARLGMLPLLLAAGALWADPRVPEHQRPPPVRRRGCGAPGCEDGYTPSGTCTTCNGLGADLPPGGSRR